MKKHFFFCLSLLLLLTACGKSDDVEQLVTGGLGDTGGTTTIPTTPATPSTGVKYNGYYYVDLGLPSGTLWATTNVGASSPADYGKYFAWGETSSKTFFSWNNYKWCRNSETSLTKYNDYPSYGSVDYLEMLEPADDVATTSRGDGWRMPTEKEIEELCNAANCTWEWTTRLNSSRQSINGYLVTSKTNGNSIFLPAAGGATRYTLSGEDGLGELAPTGRVEHIGSSGSYWSKSLANSTYNALTFSFGATTKGGVYSSCRNSGHSVRPVCAPYNQGESDGGTGEVEVDGHSYVDLGLPSGTLWATTNVGATSPIGAGYYYAWGEVTPKSTYNWYSYKWANGSEYSITKYNTVTTSGTLDNKTELEPADDAATVNWGSNWRIPNKAEWEELCNASNCTWMWQTKTNEDGSSVNGYKVTSKTNGNSIFLPAAGHRYNRTEWVGVNIYGYYWGSALGDSYSPSYEACGECLHFSDDSRPQYRDFDRSAGSSVRPVFAPASN